jgi:hypothetical protein
MSGSDTSASAASGTTAEPTTGDPDSESSAADTASAGCDPAGCVDNTCEFEACGCALAQPEVDYTDCGSLVYFEPPELWIAAHECVAGALAAQASFKIALQYQGLDSQIGEVLVGVAGAAYELRRLRYDSYGPEVALRSTCGALVSPADCEVDAGELCFDCEDQSEPQVMCKWVF